MVKFRKGKPLAVALFGVIAMAILVACGGGGTTESAQSSDPQPASGSDSPLAVLGAVTKAIESKVGEQKTDPGSAIAALIQGAESQTAPLAEAITKDVAPVIKQILKQAMPEAENLADSVARALESNEPLAESLLEAAEALTKDLSDEAASVISSVMSDALSSNGASAEELVEGTEKLLEDTDVPAVLSETLQLADQLSDELSDQLNEAVSEAKTELESATSLLGTPATSPATSPEGETASTATTFDQFGFSLTMDLGSEIRTAEGSASKQGAINFPVGEINSILTWVPQAGSTPLALVSGTYDILKANQTDVSFDSINDGEISVNGELGVYLGFKSTNDDGASLGGGLIGAWACADEGTAYTLTLTGADASTLQIRFDRVLENFSCAA